MTPRISDIPAVAAVLARFPGAQLTDVRVNNRKASAATMAKARASYSLAALADTAEAEAFRIDNVQQALVASGDRDEPHPDEMERACRFEAMARLFRRIAADQVILDRLRAAAKGGA